MKPIIAHPPLLESQCDIAHGTAWALHSSHWWAHWTPFYCLTTAVMSITSWQILLFLQLFWIITNLLLQLELPLFFEDWPSFFIDFFHSRVCAAFDVALKFHRNIHERDIEVGRNAGFYVGLTEWNHLPRYVAPLRNLHMAPAWAWPTMEWSSRIQKLLESKHLETRNLIDICLAHQKIYGLNHPFLPLPWWCGIQGLRERQPIIGILRQMDLICWVWTTIEMGLMESCERTLCSGCCKSEGRSLSDTCYFLKF